VVRVNVENLELPLPLLNAGDDICGIERKWGEVDNVISEHVNLLEDEYPEWSLLYTFKRNSEYPVKVQHHKIVDKSLVLYKSNKEFLFDMTNNLFLFEISVIEHKLYLVGFNLVHNDLTKCYCRELDKTEIELYSDNEKQDKRDFRLLCILHTNPNGIIVISQTGFTSKHEWFKFFNPNKKIDFSIHFSDLYERAGCMYNFFSNAIIKGESHMKLFRILMKGTDYIVFIPSPDLVSWGIYRWINSSPSSFSSGKILHRYNEVEVFNVVNKPKIARFADNTNILCTTEYDENGNKNIVYNFPFPSLCLNSQNRCALFDLQH
jgi:hypothetical protein